jgi:hypothetical protein
LLRRAEQGLAKLEIEELQEAFSDLEFNLADIELLYLFCDQLARGHRLLPSGSKARLHPLKET